MHLWLDVCDATWQKTGSGPITVKSATIDRLLDGAGSLTLECVATDERTVTTLTLEKRVKVYVSDESGARLIAKGVVRRRDKSFTSGGLMLAVSGPDSLDDLKRYSVLLNRQYTQQPRNDVFASLVGLAGWTVDAEATGLLLSARFDGVSVLSAVQKICEQNGLHLREALTENSVLEIGTFGADCGVVALSADSLPTGVYGNHEIAIIESVQKSEDTEAIANWLIPIGAGEGEAALTLRYATRPGIQTMTGADGRTLYFMTNPDSIATYGVIQKAGTFKDIAPLTNSPASKEIASNALYDAAKAWLDRNSIAQYTYTLTLKKVSRVIRPGDKIRVKYVGDVELADGKILQLEHVDDVFWVTQVRETYTPDGMTMTLQVSNVDQVEKSVAQTIIGALEGLRVQNLKPATFPATFTYTYTDFIQRNHFSDIFSSENKNAEFKLSIGNNVTEVVRVKIRFKTKPLYSLIDFFDGVFLPNPTQPNRQLGQEFRVRVGSNYPMGLRLYINGVDVTNKYGGPWNPSGNVAVDVELDITEDILNASGGIYREHAMVFRADYRFSATGMYVGIVDPSSNGVVELTTEVLAICQAILPT